MMKSAVHPGDVVIGPYCGTDVIGRVVAMAMVKISPPRKIHKFRSVAAVLCDDGETHLIETSALTLVQKCPVKCRFLNGTSIAILA